jgi:hypothetical protein
MTYAQWVGLGVVLAVFAALIGIAIVTDVRDDMLRRAVFDSLDNMYATGQMEWCDAEQLAVELAFPFHHPRELLPHVQAWLDALPMRAAL